MYELIQSSVFVDWLTSLRDLKAKARILARLRSAALGSFGDCEAVGEGVSEMRVHFGAGYRVYFKRSGASAYVILTGGDIKQGHYPGKGNGSGPKGATLKTTYTPFDAAAYLDSDDLMAEYLSAAAEDPNPDVFLATLGDVAKAKGMAQIARDSGLGRESLYKALSPGAHPRHETIKAVLHALGVKFAVVSDARPS